MDLRFGAFLAPHHLPGESLAMQLQRDIDLAVQLDRLGFDEYWCGEHHSTGWETIASPEMFLAGVAMRTHRIKLGTGVVSLPYHHPFNVAQRIVQLDHMSQGRAILGTGPGALPSDAAVLGIDPMVQRDRQDEAIGVLIKLLRGERVSYSCEWFELHDAALQILPVQRDLEIITASMVSPSGMTLAGKHGIGVISIGSMSTEGIQSLPLQWSFAEESATTHDQAVDRSQWRILFNWHLAETREQAEKDVEWGLLRWHNDYNVDTLQRIGATHFDSTKDAVEAIARQEGSAAIIGTPDELVARIRQMYEVCGGFGAVIGFISDWASPEATARSWDMVARYVIPEVRGMLEPMRRSNQYIKDHRDSFAQAGKAVMAKIAENERAMDALRQAPRPQAQAPIAAHHSPLED